MKIKSDFVTNSSSTCYIVFVPENFVLSDDLFDKTFKNLQTYYNEEDGFTFIYETVKKDVKDSLNDLKNGHDIIKDSYGDGLDYKSYEVLYEILSAANLGLTKLDISGDGFDIIQGITQKQILKVLTESMGLDSLVKIEEKNEE